MAEGQVEFRLSAHLIKQQLAAVYRSQGCASSFRGICPAWRSPAVVCAITHPETGALPLRLQIINVRNHFLANLETLEIALEKPPARCKAALNNMRDQRFR